MENQNQLEEKVQHLEKEVDVLKLRIHQLESRIYAGNEQGIQQEVKSNIKPEKAVVSRVPKKSQINPRERRNEDEVPIDWEKLLLQVWMPRLFIFVLIIGVLWGFKAASDYGIINEPVKIALGFMASGLLLYVGHKQMKQDRRKFGHVLLGGAIPLLMLTTFAMHSLYGMAGPAVAFVLNVLWIMLGLVLTKAYESEALGIISMVGGVLVPFLIESETPNPYVFLAYETLLYVWFLALAVRFNYRKIYYGSSILLNMALFFFYSFTGGFIRGYFVAVPIIIQYVLILYYFVKTNKQVLAQANTLLTSLFITYAWVNGTFTEGYITLFLLAFILIYAALSHKRKSDCEKVPMFHIHFIVLTAFLIIHAVDEQFTTSLLLIQGTAAYYSVFKYPSVLKKVISLFIYAAAGVMVLVEGVIYEAFSMETLDWLVLLVTFGVGAKLIYKHEKIKRDFFVTVSSAVFTLLFLIFTTQFTLACIHHMSDDSQRLILTFVWLLLSLSSIGAGVIKENKQAKYIGVVLLILTLLKLVFLDIPYIPLFIRAILFIALGFAGLMVSRVFYKNK
ncbi:putative membrane protein [Bacillus fengqiuensis]|nr:putative membrane protein [Bacillus fengqiuensis]